MIAALEKAESLQRFAKSQGAHLSTFVLVLSDDEALELLDWFVEQHEQNDLLDLDVEDAKRRHNPWPVLEQFSLLGFSMAPVVVLH